MNNEMEIFNTRAAGDAGFRVELVHPVTGDPTPHWIEIVSVDSHRFELADTIARRRTGEIQNLKTEEEKALLVNEITRDLIGSLVTGWSFSMPCTLANVTKFLESAPHIANAINQLAGKRALFTKSSMRNSEPTPQPASNSTESRPEATTAEGPT